MSSEICSLADKCDSSRFDFFPCCVNLFTLYLYAGLMKCSHIMQRPNTNGQRSLTWEMQKGSEIIYFQFLCRVVINLEPGKKLQNLINHKKC